MTSHIDLQPLKELLSDKSRWTQGVFARTATGQSVGSTHESATCWCLLGALYKLLPYPQLGEAVRQLCIAAGTPRSSCPGDYEDFMVRFNDRHSHEEVLELIDKAMGPNGNKTPANPG